MAYDADPTSLDPHEQLASATLQLSHLTFDPLLRFRQDLTLEPRLAKSWEKIDERTTRFHLREGVKFHSGRTLSAQDVVWTFNRLKQSPDFKALFEPFSEAKAVDDLTVDLITKGPYPLVLNLATYIFPMDREFYTGTDERGPPQGRDLQARRVLRLEPCLRHRAVHRHRARAGGEARVQALRRLLGQVLARQCRSHRVHADQGARHPRRGAARGRRRFHRAGAADRFRPDQGRSLLPADHHAFDAHPHLRAEPGPRRRLQGSARAACHQLRDQPARHRRQDHARLRHARGRAQPAGLCRLRSRARARASISTRPRR